MELNLLEKTELWIENIKLQNANLSTIAEVVADVLEIPKDKVLVVDVRENHITLDILQKTIQAEQVFGKKQQLLKKLSEIPGVNIVPETDIHSEGILGFISLDESEVPQVLARTEKIVDEIKMKIAKRVIVFPTGFEVKRGMIADTNTPYIIQRMTEAGYKVTKGEILDDSADYIAAKLNDAVNSGYGLIITTGGIGAEDKDRTVEGVLLVDPQAATPYIVKYQQGTGRHEKNGVRIAVGMVGNSLIVSLPGPHDEVKLALDVLIRALDEGKSKEEIAQEIAGVLRAKLQAAGFKHH
ncbi:molybdopterin-binding protein [Carboxydothermus hydrogenoformans]|uniref:Probable molybdopterin binding domain protein n=1 Tax=Carboxydothermus hydrogenoformans (strain ATCC BAA-161 / DSM 6008 / Z-2901) TaxID=246194 RepID=Q3ACM3_CARHZ|nr:molybdopterin-binding protein [Carboxydothermus hydrogenoformans]ABB15031.1 probable molybdopterin binding domain protein [Carboxydothermus hydrogenoformans Z-2901]